MNTTAAQTTDEISPEAIDRYILAVDHAVEQARRSAVRTDPVGFRRWILRGDRRVRFLTAWGLL